jgi:hypothetical protein
LLGHRRRCGTRQTQSDFFLPRRKPLKHDQRRKQFANLLGEIGMGLNVLGDRRTLALAIAPQKLVGELIDQFGAGDNL